MLHRRCRLLTLALLALQLCAWTLNASEPQFASPLAKLELADGDAVVFLGDSITHQCLYTQYVEDFFYTRFPGTRVRFHNAGVGGARAWDALERFDRDVAAYKPKYVTVLLGMNDGTYQPFNQEVFDTYYKDMTELIGRIKDAGATPVLMTPTMFDSRAARLRDAQRSRPWPAAALELYNSVLTYYGTWLREMAVDNGYGFVDMWGPLNNLTLEQRRTEPQFTMIRDAVHPDPPGQLVMAYAMIDNLGLRGPVSTIRLDRNARGRPRAAGGELSDVSWTDDGVSFTFKAESLPWVVPADAQTGAKLLRLGHRASAERLEVHGLAAGKYELTIDGTAVGTYNAAALARHIELQENTATPQYQRALAIAELNQKRNAGPVRSLRNEWIVFQQVARLRKQSQDKPDDAQLKDQVASLEQRRAGMEDRVAQHEQAAREIEDQIFQINQPQARKYVLRQVSSAQRTATP